MTVVPSTLTTKFPRPGFSLLISTLALSPTALAILLARVLNAPHCLQASIVTTLLVPEVLLSSALAAGLLSSSSLSASALESSFLSSSASFFSTSTSLVGLGSFSSFLLVFLSAFFLGGVFLAGGGVFFAGDSLALDARRGDERTILLANTVYGDQHAKESTAAVSMRFSVASLTPYGMIVCTYAFSDDNAGTPKEEGGVQ